jgi:hypothetical protein
MLGLGGEATNILRASQALLATIRFCCAEVAELARDTAPTCRIF